MSIKQFARTALAVILSCHIGMAQADWVQSSSPLVVKPRPGNYETQQQNPPAFSWARHLSNPASYTVEVRQGTNVIATYNTTRNWVLPSSKLPLGQYTWRVRPNTSPDWSSDRLFIISDRSIGYVVPENAVLRQRILAKSRPRSLPSNALKFAAWPAAMMAERLESFTRLQKEVDWYIKNLPVITDGAWTLDTASVATAAQAAQQADIRKQLNLRTRQLESAALLHYLTGSTVYLNEALRRGDELAAMNPLGPTSYAQQDAAPYAIASALAHAVDVLASSLDSARKAKWMTSVRIYGNQIYADLAKDNARNDEFPFDSHAISNTAGLAEISLLALGDVAEAANWFDLCLRGYINSLSPWSGPEGGFANGTAYGQYALALYEQVWQPVLHAAGVNLYEKPWSMGFVRFFMYFVPPGQQSYVFGDGHEVVPDQPGLKGFASQFASPGISWYANALEGNPDALKLLRSPYPLPASTVAPAAPGTPSEVFPGIGWAAMHTSLRDMDRTSVYFKSSPYGSYNHSHGDQNTFVLFKAGVPLLTEGGYYDYYGSPLWEGYYRSTRAHNGVTFDGGVGQVTDGNIASNLTNSGKLTAYSHSSALDYVEGDATKAYGDALTSAIRKLWFLRNTDAVVVIDKISSASARSFEFNLHAFAPFIEQPGKVLSVSYKGQSACVRPVSTGIHIERRSNLPQLAGRTEEQAVYVSDSKVKAMEFIMVIDVGCKNPAISLTSTPTGRTLTVDGTSISLPL